MPVIERRGVLPKFRLQLFNFTLGQHLHESDRGEYDFQASYQRGEVWSLEQKRNLIKSILQDLPIGTVFLNHRDRGIAKVVVVDGKQRLLALRDFVDNRYGVPGEWFNDEDLADAVRGQGLRLVFFRDTSVVFQRRFRGHGLATYETDLPTAAEELELFNRLNFGGTPHDDGFSLVGRAFMEAMVEAQRRAGYPGGIWVPESMAQQARDLVAKYAFKEE